MASEKSELKSLMEEREALVAKHKKHSDAITALDKKIHACIVNKHLYKAKAVSVASTDDVMPKRTAAAAPKVNSSESKQETAQMGGSRTIVSIDWNNL